MEKIKKMVYKKLETHEHREHVKDGVTGVEKFC